MPTRTVPAGGDGVKFLCRKHLLEDEEPHIPEKSSGGDERSKSPCPSSPHPRRDGNFFLKSST
ncbi:Hypothetical predicted protein [Pelobates cultripes]|uniref:Uncharacterized protein n=1 Tax=Pelobates cultripes TaxID=61616 RepID=A0AAD1RGJ2_PELCU|nr:Hypothetical predicted protein [Pelobates cultripes]